MPTLTKLYSLKEAGKHNRRDDCWVVVDGKVYDVTDYLDEHPGGDDVLLNATGRDATDEFNDAGHSKDAIKLMEEFCIGELDLDASPPATPKKQTPTKERTTGLTQKFVDTNWIAPAAIVGISVAAVAMFYLRKR